MLYIITAIHNAREQAERFYECLKKQTMKDYFMCVVDCGSADGCTSPLCMCHNAESNYWGDAMRIAFECLRHRIKPTDTVLLINIDRKFGQDYLERGMKYVKNGTMAVSMGLDNCGDKGSRYPVWISGGLKVDWSKFSFTLSDKPNTCGTTGLFMTGRDYIESGGFSKLLPHAWNDMEFVYRQMKRGLKIIAPNDLVLWIDTTTESIARPRNLRELFSMRCVQNPIYKSIYILKCCPLRYKPINILRAWFWIWRVI